MVIVFWEGMMGAAPGGKSWTVLTVENEIAIGWTGIIERLVRWQPGARTGAGLCPRARVFLAHAYHGADRPCLLIRRCIETREMPSISAASVTLLLVVTSARDSA